MAVPTMDIEECAAYLKVHRTTVLELADKGELPGAQVGRAWVFLADDVESYLRKRVREQTADRKARCEARAALKLDNEKPSLAAADISATQLTPRLRRKPIPKLPESLGEIRAA